MRRSAQLITYLKLTGCRVGLLINFNVPLLKQGIKRIVPPEQPGVSKAEQPNLRVTLISPLPPLPRSSVCERHALTPPVRRSLFSGIFVPSHGETKEIRVAVR